MYYDSRPLNENLNMRIQRRDAKIFEERQREKMLSESIIERRERERLNREKYSSFLENVKSTLLTEALFFFVNESLPTSKTIDQALQSEAIIYNFVNEEGATRLLNKYSTKTELLANISNLVIETYDKIAEETSCNSTDCGYHIKKSTSDDFYKKLRLLNPDQMSKRIMDNVSNQTKEFIAQQVTDNNKIEELAMQTKEKIDKVKAKTPETKESIKQEYANFYKRTSNEIRTSRPRSVFEEVVYRMSDKIVKDKSILESSYLKEDGKFNANKVIDDAVIIYTTLECMNTYKFKDFDTKSIKEVIDNI